MSKKSKVMVGEFALKIRNGNYDLTKIRICTDIDTFPIVF